MQAMLEAVVAGAGTDEIEGVEVVIRAALTASAVNVLSADGYLLATPANIGYMSGALKHFFDWIYYPCLDATQRRHYGLYVHGNNDTVGAVRAVEAITTGLRWHRARPPVTVVGDVGLATWRRAGSWAPPSPQGWSRDPHRRPERHGACQLRGGGGRLGAPNHISRMTCRAGGGSLAVARVLAGLGEDVLVAGFAGGGAGGLIEADLARAGVATAFTTIGRESRRVIEVLDEAREQSTRLSEPAPFITTEELGRFAAEFLELCPARTPWC